LDRRCAKHEKVPKRWNSEYGTEQQEHDPGALLIGFEAGQPVDKNDANANQLGT
jgi:hypothetical protein